MRNLIEEARICHGEHTTHGKFIQELADHAEELEAKLAQAVEFAEIVEKCGNGPLWDLARATLAELTGGKNE